MNSVVSPLAVDAAPGARTSRIALGLQEFYTMLAVAAGATSIYLGIIWDISWHMTIGRDTFWTPAHMAIYLGGALPGMLCGALAIRTTYFSEPADRERGINLWGGRAPLGAWIVIWGAVAMITSGPFDDWWHNAYGLDVKIISPPHILLFVGIFSIVAGALLLALRGQNQSTDARLVWSKRLFVYVGGIMLGMFGEVFLSESMPNRQHGPGFYFICSCVFPCILLGITRASKLRWAATASAATYMLLSAGMTWILPLFAATPKLGPIFHPVTHMVPHPFPLLLLVPAIALDLLKRFLPLGASFRRDALGVLIAAVLFLGVFLPAQWRLSSFLLSSAADNWVFVGNRYWSYTYRGDVTRQSTFWNEESGVALTYLLRDAEAAVVSLAAGLSWGNWMVRVKR